MVVVQSVGRFSRAPILTHSHCITSATQYYTGNKHNSRKNNDVPTAGSNPRRFHDRRTGEQRLRQLSGFRPSFPVSSLLYLRTRSLMKPLTLTNQNRASWLQSGVSVSHVFPFFLFFPRKNKQTNRALLLHSIQLQQRRWEVGDVFTRNQTCTRY